MGAPVDYTDLPCIMTFAWYLTCQGWSPGGGDELLQTDRHYANLCRDSIKLIVMYKIAITKHFLFSNENSRLCN